MKLLTTTLAAAGLLMAGFTLPAAAMDDMHDDGMMHKEKTMKSDKMMMDDDMKGSDKMMKSDKKAMHDDMKSSDKMMKDDDMKSPAR